MSSGEKGWTWDFLAHEGRRYLARFLRTVQGAIMPALELAAFHDVDEGEMGGLLRRIHPSPLSFHMGFHFFSFLFVVRGPVGLFLATEVFGRLGC